jgi:hypothetical protein
MKRVFCHEKEKLKMKNFLNGSCKNGESLLDFHLKEQINKFEIENQLKDCAACQDVSNESLRLKKILKRAVEKDFAPQSLVGLIRSGIRR